MLCVQCATRDSEGKRNLELASKAALSTLSGSRTTSFFVVGECSTLWTRNPAGRAWVSSTTRSDVSDREHER